jgi:hypothetical protein
VIDDTGLFNDKLQEWEDFWVFGNERGAVAGSADA